MKIQFRFQNLWKEKSGWANHTALDTCGGYERLEQFELALEELGGDVFFDHSLVFFFRHSLQCLVAPLAGLDVHIGHPLAVAVLYADKPLAPEPRVGDVEIETALVGNLDGLNRTGEDVVVRTMFTPKPIESANDCVRDRGETSFPQFRFERRPEGLILRKTHASLLSYLCWNVLSATATVTDYRQTMISIMLKVSILDHKSQEATSVASWECLKNFSFLLLTESGISFCPEKSVRFGRRARAKPARGIDFSFVVQYSKDSPNAFFRKNPPVNPPAGGRKGGGAAPLKTAKEPEEKHRLEPYFIFGGRKFFNPILKPRKSP